jgi:hypothetical protein
MRAKRFMVSYDYSLKLFSSYLQFCKVDSLGIINLLCKGMLWEYVLLNSVCHKLAHIWNNQK